MTKSGRANARLIAAAPDLLEALRLLVDVGDVSGEEFERYVRRAQAALARAEGRD
ncbi:MAG: hypothetical protein JO352_33560 [Chloroflexi bacterium]|nr:hypothetical protein [Chloroflexota bacterium]MBV9601715.1 hypothetical protein [Chloroflexota bacterium]